VIEGYAHTLRALLALAYFMPVLNSMAGNLGIQTVALMVRGFATGEIQPDRLGVLVAREVGVASLIASASGALVAAVALGWQQVPVLSAIAGLSMVLALLLASTVGVAIPVLLSRMGRDPAVASGPLVTSGLDLTTVTIYFTVASLLLAWIPA
jgi:magnesium transporter